MIKARLPIIIRRGLIQLILGKLEGSSQEMAFPEKSLILLMYHSFKISRTKGERKVEFLQLIKP